MAAGADAEERYERRELLQPGVVETWSGFDRTLQRPVTIRRAEADSEVGNRLRLQAKALARVEHHGLLHILDTHDDGEHFAIITEQLPTRLLADDMTAPDGTPRLLAAPEALRVVIAVAEALAVLHGAGFAHGGVDATAVGWRAEVGWIVLDGPPTADAASIPATRQADMASLAVLAHRLIAGAAPAAGPDGRAEIDPSVPEAVAAVLREAMVGSRRWPEQAPPDHGWPEQAPPDHGWPEQGWPDLRAMLLALRSALADVTALGAAAEASAPPKSLWQAERHWIATVGVLVAAAAALVGAALLFQPAEDSGPATTRPTPADTAGQNPSPPAETADGQAPDSNEQTGTAVGGTTEPPTTQPQAGTVPDASTTAARRQPIPIAQITDFDPEGDDGQEHPERLAFINDGEPTTAWSTERYTTRDFGGLKKGVGLFVQFGGDGLHSVARLSLDSPTVDWAFEVYATTERNPTRIDWGDAGDAVASANGVTGPVTLNLPPADAAALLVWITDLGTELRGGGHRVTISRVQLAGPAASSDAAEEANAPGSI